MIIGLDNFPSLVAHSVAFWVVLGVRSIGLFKDDVYDGNTFIMIYLYVCDETFGVTPIADCTCVELSSWKHLQRKGDCETLDQTFENGRLGVED